MFNFTKRSAPTTVLINGYATLTGSELAVDDLWQQRHAPSNLAHVLAQTINVTDRPLDIALIQYMQVRALSLDAHQPLYDFVFDHHTGASGTIWHHGAEYQLAIKGMPERVLEHCDMSENEREVVMMQLQAMSANGSYIVALATGIVKRPIKRINDLKKDERLTFVGFVSLKLNVSSAARQCVATATQKGITLYFASGIHPAAVYYLTNQLSLAKQPQDVYDARHFDTLNSANLLTAVSTANIFARATAEQKERILDAIKTIDHSATAVNTIEDFKKLLAN